MLLVFCVHAAGNAGALTLAFDVGAARLTALTTTRECVLFWLYRSHHGVFLFFLLSGFLIGRMWWPRPVMRYATFAWRRTLRIYPAFLLAFAASLLFAWGSGTWQPPDVQRLAGNLLFLNGVPASGVVAFNIVTWSLFYEMTFYLAFPAFALAALAAGPRAGPALWSTGVALPIVAVAFGADPLVLCWSLLFIGVALAVHEARLGAFAARIPTAAVVLAYFAVTSLALFDVVPGAIAVPAFGAAALLVVAKCLRQDNAIAWLLTRPPLRALGRVSYSFYLVHWMVVVLVARAVAAHAAALGPVAETLLIFAAGFSASVVAAAALWWLAERPYFTWVTRRT